MDFPVPNHTSLSSEKYYVEKLEGEVKAYRRKQAGQTIKTFTTYVALSAIFAVCGYALYMTPTFVPQCIDLMRSSGVLSY